MILQNWIRRKRRKLSAFFGFFYLCFCLVILWGEKVYAKDTLKEYDLYATAAVLMDGDTGRVLFGKNEEEHLANASTTKILTCIVVLENSSLDDYLCVSKEAAMQPDVQANLNSGEYYLVGDLLYSIMLESHNDSAYALAEYVGGSIEGFADMMNETAKRLGCENSFFVTPNGLDGTDEKTGISHGTSAKDLAKIMKYCAFDSEKKEKFLEITQSDSYTFSNYKQNDDQEGFVRGNHFIACVNHNTLLHSMAGMISGKTGFTNKAGYCYVGAVVSEERRFIIAVLGCGWPPNKTFKWSDAKKMIDYGEKNYHLKNVMLGDVELIPVTVKNGIPKRNSYEEEGKVSLLCEHYQKKILLGEEEEIAVEIECPMEVKNRILEEECMGDVLYKIGDFIVEKQEIYALNSVCKKSDQWAVFLLWKMFIKEFYLF